MDYGKEFRKFAQHNTPIGDGVLNSMEGQGYNTFNPQASMTPYILEEREMRVTQMDIFSRLMMDRIIWVSGPVNDNMSNMVCAQMMFLDNLAPEKDIKLYISTPGGSVMSGLSMVATMEYIKSDVSTINLGMAASMGSILLGAGTKGKRHALKYSRVMLHQVSAGYQGNIQDIEISYEETKKYNDILFGLLGEYTGKSAEQVKEDSKRDFWLNPQEALDYGIVDSVIANK
jgi:ATP-dependent Clp protease, protease subunit